MGLTIDPTEKRDQPLKGYSELSVKNAIVDHQIKGKFFSFSEALRDLVIKGICSEQEVQAAKPCDG